MENILQEVNIELIALSDAEIRRNNRILDSVVQKVIAAMKENSPLFNAMFRRVFYGGSFYDGLKVGIPEEFDLDLLLMLPKCASPVLTTSNIPGFVHVQLKDLERWKKQPEAASSPNFEHYLLDDKHYLSTEKVLSWMEGLVQRALNEFAVQGTKRILMNAVGTFEIAVRKGGPALTLTISGCGVKLDVDLVACFVFSSNDWPQNGFRSNPCPRWPEFFVVPKKPKARENAPIPRYWRLSFQEQERQLIGNKEKLKPAVRLVKKLRDNLQHKCIASYFIKTVVLHMIDNENDDVWRGSLSTAFMTLLKVYQMCIENKSIPYYWKQNNNLLNGIDPITLDNISNRLRYVIKDFENNPETIVDYFLVGRAKGGQIPEPVEETSSCLIS